MLQYMFIRIFVFVYNLHITYTYLYIYDVIGRDSNYCEVMCTLRIFFFIFCHWTNCSLWYQWLVGLWMTERWFRFVCGCQESDRWFRAHPSSDFKANALDACYINRTIVSVCSSHTHISLFDVPLIITIIIAVSENVYIRSSWPSNNICIYTDT